jgi:glycosyltransferase involved in cell wall biosynthesis
MNIGIYADALQTKRTFGIGNFLINFLSELEKKRDIDISLLLLENHPYILPFDEKREFKKQFYGIKIPRNKLFKPLNKIIAHNQISSKTEFDVLYWPHQQIYFFSKPRSPLVFTLHDLIPLKFPHWHSKFMTFFDYSIMLRRAIKLARKIICVSFTTKMDLEYFFGRKKELNEKLAVIYNGIDIRKYYPRSKKEIEFIRKKFGISKDYILYTGGFHPRKNVETLIKAFGIVKKKYDLQLVLTGEGLNVFKNFDTAYHSCKEKRDIIILGFIPQHLLPPLYSGATIYVNPSLYEGFGFGPIEALSCGVPVIASNIPVVNEILPIVEKFNPLNTKELAEKISLLIENKKRAKEIVRKGKKITKVYSLERMINSYIEIFESL